MGLNGEVCIRHKSSQPPLSPPLGVTIDAGRRRDSADAANKRQEEHKTERTAIRVTSCDQDIKLTERRREMAEDKRERRLSQERGEEGRTLEVKKGKEKRQETSGYEDKEIKMK